MAMLIEIARAKVNLTLAVHGRRGDGYHELESLVAFADVGDTVTVDPDAGDRLTVGGPFARAIGGHNLLGTATTLLREADPRLRIGAVHLEKRLPVAAGLGGGSADAAALLRAVRRANADRAGRVPWMEIAARLGSDVPVCLAGRPALIRGRGERLAPLPCLPPLAAVLINPGVPLATAAVFAALGAGLASPTADAKEPPALRDLPEMLDYIRARGNDLEPAAIRLLPAIGQIKALLYAQEGCLVAAMSGSGPTCFGIFATPAAARCAATSLAAQKPGWWVVRTALAGA